MYFYPRYCRGRRGLRRPHRPLLRRWQGGRRGCCHPGWSRERGGCRSRGHGRQRRRRRRRRRRTGCGQKGRHPGDPAGAFKDRRGDRRSGTRQRQREQEELYIFFIFFFSSKDSFFEKMFFLKAMERDIKLKPSAFGPRLQEILQDQLHTEIEGRWDPKYG